MKGLAFIIQDVCNETIWFYHTKCLEWKALILSYGMFAMKRFDFIVQGVCNETPRFIVQCVCCETLLFYHTGCMQWRIHFYHTECLLWNALILSYRVSAIKRLGFIVQDVYYEKLWCYHTGCPYSGNVLKIGDWFCQMIRNSCVLQGPILPPKLQITWRATVWSNQRSSHRSVLTFLIKLDVFCHWYLSAIRTYPCSLLPENTIISGPFIVDTL